MEEKKVIKDLRDHQDPLWQNTSGQGVLDFFTCRLFTGQKGMFWFLLSLLYRKKKRSDPIGSSELSLLFQGNAKSQSITA